MFPRVRNSVLHPVTVSSCCRPLRNRVFVDANNRNKVRLSMNNGLLKILAIRQIRSGGGGCRKLSNIISKISISEQLYIETWNVTCKNNPGLIRHVYNIHLFLLTASTACLKAISSWPSPPSSKMAATVILLAWAPATSTSTTATTSIVSTGHWH